MPRGQLEPGRQRGSLPDHAARAAGICPTAAADAPSSYTLYALGAVSPAGFVMIGSSPFDLALAGLAVGVFAYSEQPVRQALFSDAMHGVSPRAAFGPYFAISQSVGRCGSSSASSSPRRGSTWPSG